mmetsp:Transcript_80859/g.187733  ORF Transcript_80859/g.187733 Transcript_80859/m.187733 type:complete len:176 (-) Transcript_80859:239-766(-)|eukprot:CAMPEP_0171096298 /NCGR_PEP_ID=MMETSP0766_2-20121228/44191_1 /TAXON_ID=439317 /ORGANISM="Gambierdiscus australes, Strain CAWD 149" /LENGTH=175 /DNA_ID=CAMNT_0011555243 /DNA_START=59 /DNA_END=586 /DNA_ORIENTATION=+
MILLELGPASDGMLAEQRAPRLTEKQERQLKEVFDLFDDERDGQVTRAELGNMLRCAGLNPTRGELEVIFEEVDEDGSGTIRFQEFAAVMSQKIPQARTDDSAMLLEAFDTLDTLGTGCLDGDRLRRLLTTCGDAMTDLEVDQVMDMLNSDSDNIYREEFMKLARLHRTPFMVEM